MDPPVAAQASEAIFVPPRPNPGPVSIEVPVSNAMTAAVALVLAVCVAGLLATRSGRRAHGGRGAAADPAGASPSPDERIARAVAAIRRAASEVDGSRLGASRTTEELASDPEVILLLGETTGRGVLEFLAASDRLRYSGGAVAEEVARLEAWSSGLAGEIRRRAIAGARSRIKGK